jgi:integrase/recombinase XerD
VLVMPGPSTTLPCGHGVAHRPVPLRAAGLDLGSIDGRESERRLKVTGKGVKVRFVPIDGPLELVINFYRSTRKSHSPNGKLTPFSPLFVDHYGERHRRGGAQYLVRQSCR